MNDRAAAADPARTGIDNKPVLKLTNGETYESPFLRDRPKVGRPPD